MTASFLLLAVIVGDARAQAILDPAHCYGLNAKNYLVNALHDAAVAKKDLTLTIAVLNNDVFQVSGTEAEWGASMKSALDTWMTALRAQLVNTGVPLPKVNFNVVSKFSTTTYDVLLKINPEGVNDEPGVPPMFDPARPDEPKYSGYTLGDEWSRPFIVVFSTSLGWDPKKIGLPSYRSKVQRELLVHEAGHALGLWDLYDRSQPKGVLAGFEQCIDNVMFKPRLGLGAGDKAGIKAKYIAAFQPPGSGSNARSAAFATPGPVSAGGGADVGGSYESNQRFLVYLDDPLLYTSGVGAGYLLDSFGGITPFGDAPALNTSGAPYWAGWDIARSLTVLPDASGGWILDGWGGIHNFGTAPRIAEPAYWPGWDIARDLVVLARPGGGYMGYVLDGWGGLHPFGGAPAFAQGQPGGAGLYPASNIYHPGLDAAVALMPLYDTPTGGVQPAYPTGGLVLARNGVMTRFGKYGAPGDYHDTDPRFPSLNHALLWKKFAMMPSGAFYAVGPADPAQASQSFVITPIGSPDAMVVPNLWDAWDIVRDVVPYKPDCLPSTDPVCLQ